MVSTSVDGLAFTSSVAVMSCHAPGFQCGGRIAGKNKNAGPSYPQAVTVTVTVTAPTHIDRHVNVPVGLYVMSWPR